MKKKKLLLISALLIVSIIFLSLIVSAQTKSIVEDAKKFIDNSLTPLFSGILGQTPTGEFLFAKFLFLIIILAIVWTALEQVDFFSSNTWVLWIVSIGASILATRWLGSEALIRTIILPYSALGIAISAGLPFLIYFWVVDFGLKKFGSTTRRIAWVFFAIIFAGLWITRRETLTAGSSYAGYIYPVTVLAAIIMAAMDGTIHRLLINLEHERTTGAAATEAGQTVKSEMAKLSKNFAEGTSGMTEAEYNSKMKILRRRLREISKYH